jgi:hypothetical protein
MTRASDGPLQCRRFRSTAMIVLLAVGFTIGSVSSAPAASPTDKQGLYNWAYAAAFGTGAYRIGEDSVFILRITPEVELGRFGKRGDPRKADSPGGRGAGGF